MDQEQLELVKNLKKVFQEKRLKKQVFKGKEVKIIDKLPFKKELMKTQKLLFELQEQIKKDKIVQCKTCKNLNNCLK